MVLNRGDNVQIATGGADAEITVCDLNVLMCESQGAQVRVCAIVQSCQCKAWFEQLR